MTLSAAPSLPRVLSIAGTDPTGGAGMQADIKSIFAAGGYAMGVVTALVAQNTCGVRSLHIPDISFLEEQLRSVAEDVTIDAIKIGMLGTEEIITVVSNFLSTLSSYEVQQAVHYSPRSASATRSTLGGSGGGSSVPTNSKPSSSAPINSEPNTLKHNETPCVVLDPVMVATSGDSLLDSAAEEALRQLCTRVDVITPNIPELAILLEESPATSLEEAIAQAQEWSNQHGTAVIVKGGHLRGNEAGNALVRPHQEPYILSYPRIATSCTHGTGCSLSSALATRLVQQSPEEALKWTSAWIHEAIKSAEYMRIGQGNGPINHGHYMM